MGDVRSAVLCQRGSTLENHGALLRTSWKSARCPEGCQAITVRCGKETELISVPTLLSVGLPTVPEIPVLKIMDF